MLAVPPPSLGTDLGRLLAGQEGTDFDFIVEGQASSSRDLCLCAIS